MHNASVDIVNKQPVDASVEVFELIHTVMHLFRAEQYRVPREGGHELTHMEGKLLGFFARNPGATLRDLVAHSARDKGQLGRLIKTLKEQGLLEARGDPVDRRSVRLHLTVEGRAVHRTLQRRMGRLEKVAVKGINAADQRQLTTLLRRVRANLETAS